MRTLVRHRHQLVQMACQHIQHMQKALTQMNFQIQHVISDMTGVTGTAIIDAILAGERDPGKLAELRHGRIKADDDTLRKSLQGDWRAEHLFTLRQSREMYDAYRKQIEACDQELIQYLGDLEPKVDVVEKPLAEPSGPSRKRRTKRTGDYRFDARQQAYRLYGVDVTRIPGLDGMALSLFSELGSNLAIKFPNSGSSLSFGPGVVVVFDLFGDQRIKDDGDLVSGGGNACFRAHFGFHATQQVAQWGSTSV